MADAKICTVEGCIKQVHRGNRHSLCGAHLQRLRTYGDPLGGGKLYAAKGAARAFFDAAKTAKTDECILWPFATSKNGMPAIYLPENRKTVCASNQMCIEAHGPAPARKMVAAHSCRNGQNGCINPMHLRWATYKENSADKLRDGTEILGERAPANKLTNENVLAIVRRRIEGATPGHVAREFGISDTTVGDIWKGRSWSWLTGIGNKYSDATLAELQRQNLETQKAIARLEAKLP